MSDPRTTVVIPTYNRSESLLVTLAGLARQEGAGVWEVVIVSDGSTDDTASAVKTFAATAPMPVHFYEQTNAGPARARNRGVAEAKGEIIVFVDDDVEPSPLFVARHTAHHLSEPNLAVVAPMLPDPSRRNTEPVWVGWEHAMLGRQYKAWATGEWQGVGAHHFYTGNASLRREPFLTVGGFNETFGRQEDVELAVRLETERGMTFRFDADAGGTHRPTRTFASWLRVPFAYGSLDVTRAQSDGGRTWERVRHGYHARNAVTRRLADLCLSRPGVSGAVRNALRVAAETLYRLHRDGAAFAVLSALYNVHYLEGAASALGSADALRRVLSSPDGAGKAATV